MGGSFVKFLFSSGKTPGLRRLPSESFLSGTDHPHAPSWAGSSSGHSRALRAAGPRPPSGQSSPTARRDKGHAGAIRGRFPASSPRFLPAKRGNERPSACAPASASRSRIFTGIPIDSPRFVHRSPYLGLLWTRQEQNLLVGAPRWGMDPRVRRAAPSRRGVRPDPGSGCVFLPAWDSAAGSGPGCDYTLWVKRRPVAAGRNPSLFLVALLVSKRKEGG